MVFEQSGCRGFLRTFFLGPVVDDPVDHVVIVLKHHFSVLQRVFVLKKGGQLIESKAVRVIALGLPIQVERDHVADAQAVTAKIIGTIEVEAGVQPFENGFGCSVCSKGRRKRTGVNEVVPAFRHAMRGVCKVAVPLSEAVQLRQAGKAQAVVLGIRLQLINRKAIFRKLTGILPGFIIIGSPPKAERRHRCQCPAQVVYSQTTMSLVLAPSEITSEYWYEPSSLT